MPSPIFNSKAEARAWGLLQRAALSHEENAAISRRATERLVASPVYSAADVLLTYVGAKQGELDTRPLILEALERKMKVLVPICRAGGIMAWSRLSRLEDLAPTPRGILEPKAAFVMLEEPLGGLCIVPGVCFRRDGHRIGFGAGYYDRFLKDFEGDTMALCPEALLGVEFPVEPHDVPVAAMVTEEGMYRADATSE